MIVLLARAVLVGIICAALVGCGFSIMWSAVTSPANKPKKRYRLFFAILFVAMSLRCMDGAPAYIGFVDVANCNGIVGWVADSTRPNVPIAVSLYVDSTLTLTTTATSARSDVGAVLKDNGLHGFFLTVPQDGIPHTLTLRFEGSGIALGGSPRTLTCGVATPPVVVPVTGSTFEPNTGILFTLNGSRTGVGIDSSIVGFRTNVPPNSGAPCAGSASWAADANFLYICVGPAAGWRRIPLVNF